ncbi:MAG: hypothetical protein HYS07_03370 [Chlamydiae bacterium]|nr:hypothetical protein [Chlamydiota bacterium]MBI3276848.1 hypothetical protein [Chlamydiota bacterium]
MKLSTIREQSKAPELDVGRAATLINTTDPAAARIKQTEVYQQVIPFVEKIAVSF